MATDDLIVLANGYRVVNTTADAVGGPTTRVPFQVGWSNREYVTDVLGVELRPMTVRVRRARCRVQPSGLNAALWAACSL